MDINHKHMPYYYKHMFQNVTHAAEFVKLKGYGYTGHWSAVTGRASAVGTCSKAADSMTEFQCRVEKAIQPLNQSLTSHLSSSSHNAKLVCVCVWVWMQKPDGSMGKRIRTGSVKGSSHYQEHFNVLGYNSSCTKYKQTIDSNLSVFISQPPLDNNQDSIKANENIFIYSLHFIQLYDFPILSNTKGDILNDVLVAPSIYSIIFHV